MQLFLKITIMMMFLGLPSALQADPVQGKACTLTGGETVPDGWHGNDTGANYCNTCACEDGVLICTLMGCQPE